jgi:hypothetical protein
MRLGIRAAGSARTVGPSGLCGLNRRHRPHVTHVSCRAREFWVKPSTSGGRECGSTLDPCCGRSGRWNAIRCKHRRIRSRRRRDGSSLPAPTCGGGAGGGGARRRLRPRELKSKLQGVRIPAEQRRTDCTVRNWSSVGSTVTSRPTMIVMADRGHRESLSDALRRAPPGELSRVALKSQWIQPRRAATPHRHQSERCLMGRATWQIHVKTAPRTANSMPRAPSVS